MDSLPTRFTFWKFACATPRCCASCSRCVLPASGVCCAGCSCLMPTLFCRLSSLRALFMFVFECCFKQVAFHFPHGSAAPALENACNHTFTPGGNCNVDVLELLKDRQFSIFEFMNEDQGGQRFCLNSSTSVLSGVLQCFTSQDYMHAAVTDKFKRRVTWHRSMPFNFADTVDTNGLYLTSGMFYAQKLETAPEIKQCIDHCRKLSWCPSSSSCRVQQQSESCFMSALLLHTICVSHPLFTFCGITADAVPRLLGWMQRPILLATTVANPKHVVSIQPQSLDTWVSPALPLELHTLVCPLSHLPPSLSNALAGASIGLSRVDESKQTGRRAAQI